MTNTNILREFAQNILDNEKFSLGEAIQIENLSFIPILREEVPREEREYLTIDEALNEHLLEITDKGNEIAHIIIENKAEVPVLIEEGEIFGGQGTQDRMAVGSVIIQPQSTIEIPVKCVHAPHPLATNARFFSSGQCSRGMLRTMRGMKSISATGRHSPSSISQHAIWQSVAAETATEEVRDSSKYREVMEKRLQRVKQREITFPENTVGVISISEENKFAGMELHQTPHAFKRRKESIIVSFEKDVKENVKPSSREDAINRCHEILDQLATIDEKQVQDQIEVDGNIINLTGGVQGEFTTGKIYSDVCQECGSPKPRVPVCPKCGLVEEAEEKMMHMSF